MLIDCHAHLADAAFREDLDSVIQRSISSGVQRAILVSECADDFDRIFEIKERHAEYALAALGVHPVQQADASVSLTSGEGGNRCVTLADVERALPLMEARADRLVGVGEVGLDFTQRWCPDEESRERQREVLARQAALAERHDLTLNVHSRSAGAECLQLLRSLNVRRAHLHAFSGTPEEAMRGVQLGYFFSIPPEVVRSRQKLRLVQRLPLDRLLTETDSPVLGPERRGRNEPANARLVLSAVAEAKAVSSEEAEAAMMENALRAYPRLRASLESLMK